VSVVHIIGAGLAGLAAAVRLAQSGSQVKIYESAPRAGGRCRSYHDSVLGCTLDNGNHLVMSGNWAARAFLSDIGASDQLISPAREDFPFMDGTDGTRWSIAPNHGPIPYWLFNKNKIVPGTSVFDYVSAVKFLCPSKQATAADYLNPGKAVSHFWEPLVVAALNAPLAQSAASLLTPVLRETFLKGAHYCRPMIARHSLAQTFIDPAIARITALGGSIEFGARVKAIDSSNGRISQLHFDESTVDVDAADSVVLAVPAWIAPNLVPQISAPPAGQAIVNIHYQLAARLEFQLIGLVNSMAQWVFVRADIASVTISAADAVAEEDAATIAAQCWRTVAQALRLPTDAPLPLYRVIKERRATFDPHPATLHRRPNTTTALQNLFLAGDYVATGLPATIEGAIRSGFMAADAIRKTVT
jgi:hydroxysqualene dehydroxylase